MRHYVPWLSWNTHTMEVLTTTWTVVQFVDDKTVEAVPTSWLEGDKCYWPPLPQSKLSNAIKKLEPPQPSWIQFTVKSFRNSIFSDYVKARAKAKEAEDSSDLQSEVDEYGLPKKRKITRPSWNTSSEELSSDDTMQPTPPSLRRKPKIVTATSGPYERRQQVEEEPRSSSPIVTATSEESPSPRQQVKEEPRSSSSFENQETSQLDNNSTRLENYCKTILEQQHLLHNLLTEVLSRVERLEEKFNHYSAPGSRSIFDQNIVFPINCEQELQKFETYLQDENNFRDAINELAALGGKSNYHFVKRVMTCLITNKFATGYSWLGRKGKKVFNTLKVAKIIIDAATISGLSKTKNETEISMQSWLRRAFERSKVTAKDR
ncbi:uncharacterized protein LOC143216335 isoform X2 [Lasioglossum baleicum]|uniref:uncharacterized protein LOC143216335 isoform X2 n=1 Tax=Lasioglossum baleicum TaxID=434251 RepID=UPI003FCC500A